MYNPFIDVINQLLPEPQASLLNGILFGVRANLPRELYQALITTGTIHIIALSGQNISILTRIVSELTLPLGRKNSIIITILSILGFVLFVGIEPTITRAAIMGFLALLAVYFGRQNWSLLSLVLAAGVMLLINPLWIADISFQLSFFATLGIIIFVPQSKSAGTKTLVAELKREVDISLRTTLAAQVFTLPVVFWHFNRISLISPVTNVLIGIFIAPIMAGGLLTALMGWLLPAVGQILAWGMWVMLTWVIVVIEVTSTLPFASIGW